MNTMFLLDEDEIAILVDLVEHEISDCSGRDEADCPRSHVKTCEMLLDKLRQGGPNHKVEFRLTVTFSGGLVDERLVQERLHQMLDEAVNHEHGYLTFYQKAHASVIDATVERVSP